MQKLSVVVITLNEEKNIARCLNSVKNIADEMLVVDSYSNDKTENICRSIGAKFIQRKWEGYIEQKNFANAQAKYDLIFSIDADEAISKELEASIAAIKEKQPTPICYSMNRLTNYCGKWIRHGGWYPDKKTRIFYRNLSKWSGFKIHEYISSDEVVINQHIAGDLLHFSYYSISEHIQQTDNFTSISAQALYDKKKRPKKYKRLLSPKVKFFVDYILKAGFLDGYYGYVIAKVSSHATFLKYAKLKQLYLDAKKRTSSKESFLN